MLDPRADVVAAAGDRVVVALRWREAAQPSDEQELFQVLIFRHGRIVAMQDHRQRRAALRAVTRAA